MRFRGDWLAETIIRLERLEKSGLEGGWNLAGIRLATFLQSVNTRIDSLP